MRSVVGGLAKNTWRFEWEDVTSGIFTIAEKCMCVSVHINDFI